MDLKYKIEKWFKRNTRCKRCRHNTSELINYSVLRKMFPHKHLHEQPDIISISHVFSPNKIQKLLKLAELRFQPSTTTTQEYNFRTSYSCMFTPQENPLIQKIENKMKRLVYGWHDNRFEMEGLQLVRYFPNQEFKAHVDYFTDKTLLDLKTRGQRCLTFLIYLETPELGGETEFTRLGIKLPPQFNTGIIWANTVNNVESPITEHAGLPVFNGRKIAMNIWIRSKPKLTV